MIDMEANQIKNQEEFGRVSVVENNKCQYAVIDGDGKEIVPFGKYAWISGFDAGLARVKTHGHSSRWDNITGVVDFENDLTITGKEAVDAYYSKLKSEHPEKFSHWGIINMDGEEVLPAKYDAVWNFFGKHRSSTKVELDGRKWDVFFKDLEGSDYYCEEPEESYYDDDYDDYGTHYGEYAGSYAQDVMGYSDEEIDDAFEGDPDMYWNID